MTRLLLAAFLAAFSIAAPAQLAYRDVLAYKAAREKDGLGINSIIHELKFLGVVMGEAVTTTSSSSTACPGSSARDVMDIRESASTAALRGKRGKCI